MTEEECALNWKGHGNRIKTICCLSRRFAIANSWAGFILRFYREQTEYNPALRNQLQSVVARSVSIYVNVCKKRELKPPNQFDFLFKAFRSIRENHLNPILRCFCLHSSYLLICPCDITVYIFIQSTLNRMCQDTRLRKGSPISVFFAISWLQYIFITGKQLLSETNRAPSRRN